MKRLIQKALRLFGYQLSRIRDPFVQQQRLLEETPAPIIFDVGAHIGLVSRRYRRLMPEASIYGFEPFPDSFAKLKHNTAGDNKFSAFQLALADRQGTLRFNSNAASATNSLLEPDPRSEFYWGEGIEPTGQIEVQSDTIDNFCKDHSIDRIDVLKLDVQGGEYLVLLGARKMLEDQAIALVYSEIILQPTYKSQRMFHEVVKLLELANYEMFNIYNMMELSGQLIQIDALFISEQFKHGQSPWQRLTSDGIHDRRPLGSDSAR